MLAILSKPGDFAKFSQKLTTPYYYVTLMTGWVEDVLGAGNIKKEFRWNTTNKEKTSWMDLTNLNLSSVILDPNDELFVDFRFTLIAGGPITINDIYLLFNQSALAKDKFLGYRPALLVSERGNISNLTKIENFTFKPYNVNSVVTLYKELSYTINELFGHEVQYARAIPLANGRDVVLHEWTLYDVEDPCCVKVLVPNNEFTDSVIAFNPMGLDFEMPFEVHIVKDYFENLFGIGIGPQKRDIIYFPLTNRIYEIESSYLFKDIMQREVYWKASLKKYQPKSNRYEPQDLREQFDVLTRGFEESFGEEVQDKATQLTDPQQFDQKIGSREYDPIRLTVDENLVISQTTLQNYSIYISESQYDLHSIFNINENVDAVTYRSLVDFPINDITTDIVACDTPSGAIGTTTVTNSVPCERSLCGWFKELKPKVILPKDPVKGQLILGPLTGSVYPVAFILTAVRDYQTGDLIKITRFNGLSLYGAYVSTAYNPINNTYTLVINVKKDIVDFLNSYYPGWASSSTTSGYYAELTSETIMLNGFDAVTQTGWKLSLFASRYFVFKDTQHEYVFILPNNVIEGSWYAFFLNVNNYYNQMSLDVWIRKFNETEVTPQQTTDLENIYSKAIIVLTIDRSAAQGTYNYRLPASNLLYTNIRLFNKTETDLTKQMTILNQTIVQDAQFAIIIDNAIPRLLLPWSGKTK